MRQSSGWDFNYSAENEARLKPLCLEVEKHFRFPARRLYRYFARTDDGYMVGPPMALGEYYRGFHIPLSSKAVLPLYLSECFFHPIENFHTESAQQAALFRADGGLRQSNIH